MPRQCPKRWHNVWGIGVHSWGSIHTRLIMFRERGISGGTILLLSKGVARAAPQQQRARERALVVQGTRYFQSPARRAVMDDDDGLFRIQVGSADLLWIPETAHELRIRLIICLHMRDSGHRGTVATLSSLSEYCCWLRMEANVSTFIKQCLHCADSQAGGHSSSVPAKQFMVLSYMKVNISITSTSV